jgi:hypothetical protein
MERRNIKPSKQQKELDRQLNIMSAFGSMGLGLSVPTNLGNKDIEADLEHLTE